jgi:hypothetical protein
MMRWRYEWREMLLLLAWWGLRKAEVEDTAYWCARASAWLAACCVVSIGVKVKGKRINGGP